MNSIERSKTSTECDNASIEHSNSIEHNASTECNMDTLNNSSNKILNRIKVRKPFEFNDIFIYLFILALVSVLFICFVITPSLSNANGFSIHVGQDKIFSLDYSSGEYEISKDYLDKIIVDQEKSTITIFFDDQSSFNLVEYNLKEKWVKMLDSACSKSKDCVYEPKISSSGMIYCAPHDLKILPIGEFSPTPPVIGGGI